MSDVVRVTPFDRIPFYSAAELRTIICTTNRPSTYCSFYLFYPTIPTESLLAECDAITDKGLKRNDEVNGDDHDELILARFRKFENVDIERLRSLIMTICDITFTVNEDRLGVSRLPADNQFFRSYCPNIYTGGLIIFRPSQPIQWYPSEVKVHPEY